MTEFYLPAGYDSLNYRGHEGWGVLVDDFGEPRLYHPEGWVAYVDGHVDYVHHVVRVYDTFLDYPIVEEERIAAEALCVWKDVAYAYRWGDDDYEEGEEAAAGEEDSAP